MSSKCMKCGFVFCDDINILNGCPFCDGKKFSYLKKTPSDKNIDKVNEEKNEKKKNKSIKKLESLKILCQGSYELNLDHLFKKKDFIVELKEEGKYVIDLPSILKIKKNNKKN